MNKFMKKLGLTASLVAGLAFPTLSYAEDFSAGSKAKEFGFDEEVQATFSAKVVDVACELGGDCVDNCGNGERLMGLVREADNKLILVLKNAQLSFNGPIEDLVPYCNKLVHVDGVMVGDPELFNAQFYMMQFIKEKGAPEWNKANKWVAAWKAKNPEVAEGKGPWFRRDLRVKKQIEATGYFGLGHEFDEQYRKDKQK